MTSEAGLRIITDPYAPSERIPYREIEESADIVTVSHGHGDHSNVAGVKGNPAVVKETKEVKGIKFKAISAFHDASGGGQRGNMTIFCFEVDGIRICHLGDLGHQLDSKQIAEIGKVDILLIPVGGNYTIDARTATEVYEKLAAKIVIPMHYKNARCPNFPVASVEDFISGKSNVTRLEVSQAEFKNGVLPTAPQIVVLTPAR
ncbi:MAG: hypothetical protein A2Z28_03640 [Chloroflexi bacterium RBG_16_51_9]|nr:MAG: hypothetical protein A2Z28_03640 [Chloroflexi bacterium RBG_16_51_9]